MKLKIVVLSFISFFILFNCRSDKYIPGICFKENILPIFITKCSTPGCHDGKEGEGYDLTTYDGIMKGIVPKHPLRSPIYKAIRGKNPEMPLEGHPQLTSQEKDYIKSWIQFGASNPVNCGGTCDTSNVAYSSSVAPLLNKWCVGCHTGSSAGGGIALSNYNDVQIQVVNGKLMGSVNHLPGFIAMPKNIGKLNECDIRTIQKWIDSGYPNN